jgi:hypothetical protein
MTGILDRIRTTTVADLENVSSDLSDLTSTYRPRVPRDMQRIVEGATDLRPTRPSVPNMNAGMVALRAEDQRIDTRPFKGMPTEAQRKFINSLMSDLMTLDLDSWRAGMDYMARMDEHQAWNPARDGNVSVWIGRLKAKIANLRATSSTPRWTAAADTYEDLPDGYYALTDDEDTVKFYRVSTGRKGGPYAGVRFVKAQASDEFHPIRNQASRIAILDGIRAMGAQDSMGLYGRTIGRCGRCRRTLTDDLSRSRGIGPDCWGKM